MLTSTENIPPYETEFSQKIQFSDNDKFDFDKFDSPQQASCNESRDQIQIHSAGNYFFMNLIRN